MPEAHLPALSTLAPDILFSCHMRMKTKKLWCDLYKRKMPKKIIPFVSVEDRATVRKHMLTNCFQLPRCSVLRDDLSGPYAPWWQFADLNWVITNLKASGLSLTVTMMADGCILPSFYRKLCMLALWSSLYHSKLKNVFRYNYLYDIKSRSYEREYIGKNSLFEEGKKRKSIARHQHW